MADDKVIVKIDGDDSGFKKSLSGIGTTAQKALGIVTKGIAATTTAVGGLAVAAVKGYADCEQLVGGIETLFGAKGAKSVEEYAKNVGKSVSKVKNEYAGLIKSQQNVLKNADDAYKTAGLSANEYMETVTSFAASLKQSFADTPEGIEAAGEAANKAVIDMADNANKMGTSMEAIQTAYQGFAKQNYTMLDNLKLGYGGTKTEMERLLADAQKLSGVKYDISNLADVYEAIHVIQTEIGITGTTAKEAEQTITGSVNMMKASWKNLMVGIADENADLDKLIDNFIDSLMVVGDNILPVFETALNGIGEFVAQAADKIIPKMVDIIIGALPSLTNAATQIIIALAGAIISNLPIIIDAAKQIVISIATALGDAVPILKPITDLIATLASNFENIIPVIGGAVAAYKSYQVAVTVAKTAQLAFNAATIATPWGAIIALIGAAAGMLVGYATATREQTEEERKSASAIKECTDALDSLKKSCYEGATAAETEAAMSQNLISELKGIVEENGKIKEGYEARAAVITGELNSALGTEMTIVDGVIQKYQEEMATIDQLIEKKRAAAIVDAERPQYTEAVSQYNNALKQQAEIQQQIAEQQAIIDDDNSSNVAAQEAFAAIDELEAQLESNQALIDGYTHTITAYEQNMEALATGAYDTIRSINDATAKEIANASTLKEAENAVQIAINTYTVGLESCKRQGTEMTASMKTSIVNNIKDAIAKVVELGGEIPEGFSVAIENGKTVVVNSVDELIAILEQGLTPGGSVATTKGNEATTNYAVALAQGKGPIEISAKAIAESGWMAAGNINAPVTAAQILTKRFSIGLLDGTPQIKTSGGEAATEYSAGIEEKKSEAESSGGMLAGSSLKGIKSEQDKTSGGIRSLGKDFSSGYAKGITEGKNEAVNAAVDVAKAALQAVKDTQDSDSPAKETESLGKDFDDGYELGISENSDGAINAAGNMAKGAVDELGRSAYETAYAAGSSFSAGFAAGLAQATDDIRIYYSKLHDTTLKDLGYTYDEAVSRINQLTAAIETTKTYRDNAERKLNVVTSDEYYKVLLQEIANYDSAIANMDSERDVIISAVAKAEVESGFNVAENATKSYAKPDSNAENRFEKAAKDAVKPYEYAGEEAEVLYDIWEENEGKAATATEKRIKTVEKLTAQISAQKNIVEIYSGAYEEAKNSVGETAEETIRLKHSMLEAKKTLAETKNELDKTTDTFIVVKEEAEQNIDLIEAKYEEWCAASKNTATAEEKAAKKREYLFAKLSEQGKILGALNAKYEETVAKYGEASEASKELSLQISKEKQAFSELINEIEAVDDAHTISANNARDDIELIDAKYNAWCAASKNTATAEEKAAKKREYLFAKLSEQGKILGALNAKYEETVAKYGETSEASKNLAKLLYKETEAWSSLKNELTEHNESLILKPEEIRDIIYAYNDYLKKYYSIMKSYGMKDEDIYKLAAEVTGYDKVQKQSMTMKVEADEEQIEAVMEETAEGVAKAVEGEVSEVMEEAAEGAGESSAKKFVSSFMAEMGTVPKGFFDYGERSAEGFEEGFMRKFKNIMNNIKTRIEEEVDAIILAAARKESNNTVNTTNVTNNATYVVQPVSGESTHAQLQAVSAYQTKNEILRN